ncbi:MAG: hypothetical protein PHI32_04950 [Dysgonamonadaceae bacterium]|nr:hypothetical protein [Dysgonamonadaceae bacterium]MDD4729080.1 hypothetical protein [Dysgonamonadaceae bacterium]
MKRVLTSILVLFVLTLSVHPILSLHFCKGELYSFTLNTKNETNACCSSSFTNENNNFDTLSINLTESYESCCSFQKVEIVTDNFTLERTNTTIQEPFSFSSFPMSAVVDYLINLFTPDTIIKNNNHISPSGWYYTTLKFLSYICVYRL